MPFHHEGKNKRKVCPRLVELKPKAVFIEDSRLYVTARAESAMVVILCNHHEAAFPVIILEEGRYASNCKGRKGPKALLFL